MKLEINKDKIELIIDDNLLLCDCGGTFLPLIKQRDVYKGGGAYEYGGPELIWKCSNCDKRIESI